MLNEMSPEDAAPLELGVVTCTANVLERLGGVPTLLLFRHRILEHGYVCADERRSNVNALNVGGFVVSRYKTTVNFELEYVAIRTWANPARTVVSFEVGMTFAELVMQRLRYKQPLKGVSQ